MFDLPPEDAPPPFPAYDPTLGGGLGMPPDAPPIPPQALSGIGPSPLAEAFTPPPFPPAPQPAEEDDPRLRLGLGKIGSPVPPGPYPEPGHVAAPGSSAAPGAGLPPPDAVSGVGGAPPKPLDPYAPGAPTGAPSAEPVDPYAPKKLLEGEDLIRANAEAADRVKRERDRQTELLLKQDNDRLQSDIFDRNVARQKAMADMDDIDARAKAMADSSPWDSYWSSRDTGQKMMGLVAAFFGGFLAPANGGQNPAINLFMKRADEDAEQKWRALQMQRGSAQFRLGDANEEFKTREALRQAGREQAFRMLENHLNQLDPDGDAYRNLSGQIQQGRAQAAAAQMERFKTLTDISYKQAQTRAENDQIRHRLAEEATARISAGAAASQAHTAALKEKREGDKQVFDIGQQPFKNEIERQKTEADLLRARAETAKAGQESPEAGRLQQTLKVYDRATSIGASQPTRAKGPDGRPMLKWNTLYQADNKTPVHALSDTEGPKVRDSIEKFQNYIAFNDQLRELVAKHGWEPDFLKSKAWQDMKQLQAEMRLSRKTMDELGVIAGPDMDLIDTAIGTSDPTELRDILPGLEKSRQSAVLRFNSMLRNKTDYDRPEDVAFPDPITEPGGAQSPVGKLASKAIEAQVSVPEWQRNIATGVAGTTGDPSMGVMPDAKDAIDQIAMHTKGELRDQAIDELHELAKTPSLAPYVALKLREMGAK